MTERKSQISAVPEYFQKIKDRVVVCCRKAEDGWQAIAAANVSATYDNFDLAKNSIVIVRKNKTEWEWREK